MPIHRAATIARTPSERDNQLGLFASAGDVYCDSVEDALDAVERPTSSVRQWFPQENKGYPI